jgi:WD40 repeat protein
MKRVYRKMMLFSATVVFLAVAPLVVLYAMGYRVGTTTVDPLPVGLIQIETLPRRATVAVNGLTIGDTPRTITNIQPGNVRVRVTRDGYAPWEKTVPVEATLVTELRDIRLFPESLTPTPLLSGVATFTLSPNREFIAAVTSDRQFTIIDVDGKVMLPKIRLPQAPLEVLWSPDSSSVLLTYRSAAGQIVFLAETRSTPRSISALRGIERVVWDPRVPGRLLFTDTTGTLRAYNQSNGSLITLASEVTAFAPSSRQIITAHPDNILAYRTLQGEISEEYSLDLPSPIVELMVTPVGYSAFRTRDNSLYLLAGKSTPKKVTESVYSAGWSPDGEILYVQTGANELQVYNVGAEGLSWLPLEEMRLVVRLSRPITHPQWFAGNRHLIYQVEDEILITEIDTRDHPVTYSATTTNTGMSQATVGHEGQKLFYLRQAGSGKELVGAPLTVN